MTGHRDRNSTLDNKAEKNPPTNMFWYLKKECWTRPNDNELFLHKWTTCCNKSLITYSVECLENFFSSCIHKWPKEKNYWNKFFVVLVWSLWKPFLNVPLNYRKQQNFSSECLILCFLFCSRMFTFTCQRLESERV